MSEKKITQIQEKNELEFISAVYGVCLLFSFWNHLWLFTSSRSRGGPFNFLQHCMYYILLTLDDFSCNLDMGPLCLPWEVLLSFLEKLWVCSPAPALPILFCPSFLAIIYSSWWTSCSFQGWANLCKGVNSFLFGADGSCVRAKAGAGVLIAPCCSNFWSPSLAGLSEIGL